MKKQVKHRYALLSVLILLFAAVAAIAGEPENRAVPLETVVVTAHKQTVSANFWGPKFMDELNNVEQDNYTLVNAKIGYETDHWSCYLYGRNLLDEEYLVHTFTDAGRIGEPSVVGFQLNYRF